MPNSPPLKGGFFILRRINMSFRTVFVKNGERLSLKLDNLVVLKQGSEVTIPLVDISLIVLEGDYTTITTKILAQLSKNHIGLVVCDNQFMPCGMYFGLGQYHRSAKRGMQQSQWDELLKKNAWTQVVTQKINNQIHVIKHLNLGSDRITLMEEMRNNILLGDESNREGHVAKVYFNTLFGMGFSREDEVYPNYCLNYGYSIIRAHTARCVVALGLIPLLGIFHRNEYNTFNLVDDLMEPFRPIVDLFVYQTLLNDKDEFLTYEKRLSLIDILNHQIIINNKKIYINNAIYDFVKSFIAAMENNDMNKMITIDITRYIGSE